MELSNGERLQTRALILVPTRELADQVAKLLGGLTAFCDKDVLVADIATSASTQLHRFVVQSFIEEKGLS